MSLTFRTEPPFGSNPPSREKMREVADKVGLKKFSPSLVADFCNIAEGGALVPPSLYRGLVKKIAEKRACEDKGKPQFGGGRGPFDSKKADELRDKMMRYHERVIQFVSTVNLSRFPGATPLEQTMSFLKLLASQKGGSPSGSGSGENPLPIFLDQAPDQIQSDLEEVMDLVDSLSDSELDMVDPDGEGHETDEEQDGQRSGSQGLSALKIAEKLLPGSDERKILEIARNLNQFVQMQVKRQNCTVPDPESDEIRRRPINGLNELGKLPSSEWAKRSVYSRRYFNYLAVTGGLQVRERITQEDKKQAILILLDASGSMQGERHTKATGIVMNRLQAVVDGDAEVYLGVFDTSLDIVGEAKSPEEARELMKKFRKGNFKGGGTNIAGSVKSGHEFIDEKMKSGEALWRPEIVVLTDEDTSIKGLKVSDVPGTRVHGFAMGVSNPALVEFARSTGGVGVDRF